MNIDRTALKAAVEELKAAAEQKPLNDALKAEIRLTRRFPESLVRRIPCGPTRLHIQLTRDYINRSSYFLHVSCSLKSGQPVPVSILQDLVKMVFGPVRPRAISGNDPRVYQFATIIRANQEALAS